MIASSECNEIAAAPIVSVVTNFQVAITVAWSLAFSLLWLRVFALVHQNAKL
jgi:hypothetical protein